MRDAGQQDIQTVTLSFQEFVCKPEDEGPLAAEVARAYGTRHTTRVVSESEFAADLPRILESMDQPSIDGINTWFVAKAARELGLKVAISELGGDELFSGYPSFRDIPRWVRLFGIPSRTPLLGRLSRIVGRRIGAALGANPKAAGMLEYGGDYAGAYLLRRGLFMPWELSKFLAPDVLKTGMHRLAPLALIKRELFPPPATAAARVAALEAGLYMKNQLLRDTDWASMAHSLEVRTPLVDSVLLKTAADIAARTGVPASKSALAEAPSLPLPALSRDRPKTGFTTPIAIWQQRSLDTVVDTRYPVGQPWARQWSREIIAAA